MPSEEEFHPPDDFAPAPAEARGFSPDEMVACEKCRRANPPTRMDCFYCGAHLPATGASAQLRRPVLRPLEEWEQGFDVVLLPEDGARHSRQSMSEAASFLKMEVGRFEEMAEGPDALPVARAASAEEAALVEAKLGALGFRVETFSDEATRGDAAPPRRMRRFEFDAETLKGWPVGGEPETIAWSDVRLVAVGRIFTRRVEVEERRGRTKPGREVADAREIVSDEAALEIYSALDGEGWRVTAGNFDYSCLGERMRLLAAENFNALVAELRARATSASFDDRYASLRQLLNAAWPPAERTESGGLKRERPGKFNTEAVTVVSNDTQFTRYARLRHRLGQRRRATGTADDAV